MTENNTETLEVRLGSVFEVNSLKLPLVGETSLLKPKLFYDESALKLLNSASDKKQEGSFREDFNTFEAVKEGSYKIHFYFVEFNSEQQWIPVKDSSFYGRHEKIIEVKVVTD